jgi:hypothetical protein
VSQSPSGSCFTTRVTRVRFLIIKAAGGFLRDCSSKRGAGGASARKITSVS